MNIDIIGSANLSPPRINEPAQQVDRRRQDGQQQSSATSQDSKMQPEELLNQIKALVEDGLYSIRFERDRATEALVVRIVDSENQLIRQIPPEELIKLNKLLEELNGNLVDTIG
ncbi:MAG: flagellar protein FlaG [Desulfobulbus sp.]|nr:flagellar protein FlaG [Desulfobulbus sp.]